MGLLNWLTGITQPRQQDAEISVQAHLEARRMADAQREAAELQRQQQLQADRKKATADRQQQPGPAERAFPAHAAELRAEILGERPREQQPEGEATRHDHELRPPGYKAVPTMGVAGVIYVNQNATAPVRTVDDLLAAGEKIMDKREEGMTPEQLRQRWGRFYGGDDRNPDNDDPRGGRR